MLNNKKAYLIEREEMYLFPYFENIQAILWVAEIVISRSQLYYLCGMESFQVSDFKDKIAIRVIQTYHSIINNAMSVITWDSTKLQKLTESLNPFYHPDGFFHNENLVKECQFLLPVPIKSNDFLENILAPVQRFILNRTQLSNQMLVITLCFMLVSILKARGCNLHETDLSPLIREAFGNGDPNNLPALFIQTENTLLSPFQETIEQDCAGNNEKDDEFFDFEVTYELQ